MHNCTLKVIFFFCLIGSDQIGVILLLLRLEDHVNIQLCETAEEHLEFFNLYQ